MRGQLIQALIYSLGTAVIMWAAGLDLILLTAVVNTGLMMIPFIGPPLALVLPLSIAVFESPSSVPGGRSWSRRSRWSSLKVVAPRVMSSAVGVHPLLVFVGILVGAKLAGVWGAVFGVPAVAVIAAMVDLLPRDLEERRTRGASSLASADHDDLRTCRPRRRGGRFACRRPAPQATPPRNVPPAAPVGVQPRASART